MAAPPARTDLSDTYPNPSNAVAKAALGTQHDYILGLLGTTGNLAECKVAGRYAGFTSLGSNTTLTAASAGKLLNISATSLTITLPTGSTMVAGEGFTFNTAVSFTITRASTNTIVGPTGTGLTTIVMYGPCDIFWSGSEWLIVMGNSTTSRAAVGYIRHPEGPLIQWGSSVATLSGSLATINFPITYPGAVYTVVLCNGDTSATAVAPGVSSFNTTGFTVFYSGVGAISVRTNWWAVGL